MKKWGENIAYQLRIQNTADAEANIILDYLASKSQKAADRFYKDLHKSYATLRDGVVNYGLSRFPELAKQGYHSLLFNNYVMLYLEEDNTRIVAHIFHQRQNYAELV